LNHNRLRERRLTAAHARLSTLGDTFQRVAATERAGHGASPLLFRVGQRLSVMLDPTGEPLETVPLTSIVELADGFPRSRIRW
jgi:hypothetical protein